ncbi:MAG: hypothetical protein JWO54_601 [Candidatus Saccharibacteria bacterium]|nr:hypothetical protein [Candidatus Saccharibacteria bacterium]MDB5180841.1 hypothetical protein [Candidatus Saccharibacteria bacterium]
MLEDENSTNYSTESPTLRQTPTPLEIAFTEAAQKLVEGPVTAQGASTESTSAETEGPKAGQIFERDGVKFGLNPSYYSRLVWKEGQRMYEDVPYTYRQYYSHTFYMDGGDDGPMEPGPGWDSRWSLRDDESALDTHNRIFSNEQLRDLPHNLPNEICLFVRPYEANTEAEVSP